MQEAGRMGAAMKSKRLATSLDPDLVVEAGGEAWETHLACGLKLCLTLI